MTTVPVGLVGVTGYTGMELVRLLALQKSFQLVRATSRAEAGRRLMDLYPFLQGLELGQLPVASPDPDVLAAHCELVFLAVPHGTAMDLAGVLRAKGTKVVDLSADFRLSDPSVYAKWYKLEHRQTGLLAREAVYGLPELYAEKIAVAELVANPGCYPTASILGLYPALAHGLVETDDLVIDAKSGATGAGRKEAVGNLFCEVSDTFRAYNLGKHRHTPEIEQELSKIAGREIILSFNTHLLPINRGILATIYGRLARDVSLEEVHRLYVETYLEHPWVRVLPLGCLPETRHTRGTMYCDLGLVLDPRTKRLIIVSCIDNLCRGASGQALANANLMMGLDIREGLGLAPLVP